MPLGEGILPYLRAASAECVQCWVFWSPHGPWCPQMSLFVMFVLYGGSQVGLSWCKARWRPFLLSSGSVGSQRGTLPVA